MTDETLKSLTHIDAAGRARMVDVSQKPDTERVAIAKGKIVMQPATLYAISAGEITKGDVLAVAQVAGILGAKETHALIPMCHPLLLTHIGLTFDVQPEYNAIEMTATVRTTGKTGVEMEALTAVSIAALTIYDMAKAIDRSMKIQDIRLIRKSGGKTGTIILEEE